MEQVKRFKVRKYYVTVTDRYGSGNRYSLSRAFTDYQAACKDANWWNREVGDEQAYAHVSTTQYETKKFYNNGSWLCTEYSIVPNT